MKFSTTPEQLQWLCDLYPDPYKPITNADVVASLIADYKVLLTELVKEGPLNSECWTLDELLAELEKWKAVAGGKTCVSFENICYGASSLWHQTHRENFRKVDRKPEVLSRWMLEHDKFVHDDFPKQVLAKLEALLAENKALTLKPMTDDEAIKFERREWPRWSKYAGRQVGVTSQDYIDWVDEGDDFRDELHRYRLSERYRLRRDDEEGEDLSEDDVLWLARNCEAAMTKFAYQFMLLASNLEYLASVK